MMAENDEPIAARDVAGALEILDPLWDGLFPAEQTRGLGLLIERITVSTTGLDIKLRPTGLRDIASEPASSEPETTQEGSAAA